MRGWWRDPSRGAQFGIITQDCPPRSIVPNVFGKVVRGLEVVVAAARHRPITDVTVAECGVLLTQPH